MSTVININSTTPSAPAGTTNVSFQSDGSGNISGNVPANIVGTRASLPGTVAPAGTMYKCTDSLYEYISDGSVWQPFFLGQHVTEPIPANFSWMNQNTATLTTTYGGMQLFSPHTGGNVNIQYLAYPATPFTRTIAFLPSAIGGSNGASGFVFSDGTKIEGFFYIMGGTSSTAAPAIQVDTGPTTSAFTANLFSASTVPQTSLIWLRYSDSGTTRTYSVSFDAGSTWYAQYTEASGTFLTPTRLGVFVDAVSSTVGTGMWLAHWA